MTIPRATYRLQLQPGFGFDAAAAVVPYLAELGVSHLYISPILQAEAGSTHGYDIVDHDRLNVELGGEAGFDRLVDAVRARSLGLVVDVVPNHMAISPANRWWWDVLEHGPASPYADHFDVDWDPPESRLRNVILLPVLGDHYGRVLEAGDLSLTRDGAEVAVAYGDQRFPLDPSSLASVLSDAAEAVGSDELAFIGRAMGTLPPSTSGDRKEARRRHDDAAVLGERLAALVGDPRVADAVDTALAEVSRDHDRLDRLLEEQNYRLAFWRAGSRDLGYRRFFDIDSLVGLRVERPEVFEATHRLILDRVAAGDISGLRIDHPDGLRDPLAYFVRLREAAPDAWIVAEKILGPEEELRDWPIHGTTGYGFANLATRLQVDAAAEGPLTELYASWTDADPDWEAVAYAARLQALSDALGSDLNRLTELWLTICEANRRYRDFTRHELHEALRDVAAAFGVYRTYVRASDAAVDEEDRRVVRAATELAAKRRPDLDPDLFGFLASILLLEEDGRPAAELAARFQQLTPAAMAKGVEDTAFYRYPRFVALNEVGGEPGRFAVDPGAFHAAMLAGQRRHPEAMLSTSTHDTKRSEDLRARLAAISEDPAGWGRTVEKLSRHASAQRGASGLPDRKAEYLFYQTVVGAWPIDADRAGGYMRKAAREAKELTSWTAPDEAYEAALDRFVRGCLDDAGFRAEIETFVASLAEAGRANALAQLLWKLTAPGVPDLYQGSELWDLSLVDPDNRRPVDFEFRRRVVSADGPPPPDDAEGRSKLWLVRQGLALRARRPADLAGTASYRPLRAEGPAAEHVVAYQRGEGVVAVAPRLTRRLAADGGWRETRLLLPAGPWRDVLTGEEVAGPVFDLQPGLERFPVALMERIS
ncbi:MAG TPA: malto-oligosyltrehalose synthase [Candidatus Limnocylindria bacterium]